MDVRRRIPPVDRGVSPWLRFTCLNSRRAASKVGPTGRSRFGEVASPIRKDSLRVALVAQGGRRLPSVLGLVLVAMLSGLGSARAQEQRACRFCLDFSSSIGAGVLLESGAGQLGGSPAFTVDTRLLGSLRRDRLITLFHVRLQYERFAKEVTVAAVDLTGQYVGSVESDFKCERITLSPTYHNPGFGRFSWYVGVSLGFVFTEQTFSGTERIALDGHAHRNTEWFAPGLVLGFETQLASRLSMELRGEYGDYGHVEEAIGSLDAGSASVHGPLISVRLAYWWTPGFSR